MRPMNCNSTKTFRFFAPALLCFNIAHAAADSKPTSIASPNGKLVAVFHLDSAGAPRYVIQLDGKPVLQDSRLGLVRDDADFSKGLQLISKSRGETVKDDYEIL